MGKFAEAEGFLKQATKIEPSNKDARYKLAVVYMELQDRMSALKEYEALKVLSPLAANRLAKPLHI